MTRSPIIPQTPSEEAYRVDEDQGEVFTSNDPFTLFEDWFALARAKEPNDANAMALATAGADGAPDVRFGCPAEFAGELMMGRRLLMLAGKRVRPAKCKVGTRVHGVQARCFACIVECVRCPLQGAKDAWMHEMDRVLELSEA